MGILAEEMLKGVARDPDRRCCADIDHCRLHFVDQISKRLWKFDNSMTGFSLHPATQARHRQIKRMSKCGISLGQSVLRNDRFLVFISAQTMEEPPLNECFCPLS